jgi:hypothetical protein
MCAITRKSPTPFSGEAPASIEYREYPARPKQRGNQVTTPVEQLCAFTTLLQLHHGNRAKHPRVTFGVYPDRQKLERLKAIVEAIRCD